MFLRSFFELPRSWRDLFPARAESSCPPWLAGGIVEGFMSFGVSVACEWRFMCLANRVFWPWLSQFLRYLFVPLLSYFFSVLMVGACLRPILMVWDAVLSLWLW